MSVSVVNQELLEELIASMNLLSDMFYMDADEIVLDNHKRFVRTILDGLQGALECLDRNLIKISGVISADTRKDVDNVQRLIDATGTAVFLLKGIVIEYRALFEVTPLNEKWALYRVTHLYSLRNAINMQQETVRASEDFSARNDELARMRNVVIELRAVVARMVEKLLNLIWGLALARRREWRDVLESCISETDDTQDMAELLVVLDMKVSDTDEDESENEELEEHQGGGASQEDQEVMAEDKEHSAGSHNDSGFVSDGK